MKQFNKVEIRIVQSQEDLMKAFIVRGIVYMHEQGCPYNEEFDLNDFTATQVIGLVDGEPAMTARIRYFADFAKLERLAIREEYRGTGLGHEIFGFILKHCLEKNYKKVCLHAQKRLISFYEKYGFKVSNEEFEFSEYDYVSMVAEFSKIKERDFLNGDPMILNRPEGQWDEKGPLEKSKDLYSKYIEQMEDQYEYVSCS